MISMWEFLDLIHFQSASFLSKQFMVTQGMEQVAKCQQREITTAMEFLSWKCSLERSRHIACLARVWTYIKFCKMALPKGVTDSGCTSACPIWWSPGAIHWVPKCIGRQDSGVTGKLSYGWSCMFSRSPKWTNGLKRCCSGVACN